MTSVRAAEEGVPQVSDEATAQLVSDLQRSRLPSGRQRRAPREGARASLRDVAGALGVSPQTVHDWESGTQPRNRDLAIAYAELLEALDGAAQ